MENSLDFLSSMIDEVALEGLDGTTLPMFWKRLEDRPNFPIAIDEDSKLFLWECIAMHKEIEFYELPEPREFVPPYNRYSNVDGELGIVIEPIEKIKDPYSPIVPVKDGDVRGSCSTYSTRKNITSNIRTDDVLLLSLSQAVDRWGDTLVLVALPRTRLLALIGTETNPLIEFTSESYCLLERIGRSRYIGEVTQGDDGLLSLNAPFCKQLHYYRKKLSLKCLITKQIHYLKNKRGTTSNGCLVHLTRFYVERKTKMELLLKALCNLLKDKPQNRESCQKARQELGIKESTFKKLFYRPFQKWIFVSNVPYQEMYPNASRKESHTLGGVEKSIKVVKLLKHYEDDDDKEDDTEEHDNVKGYSVPLNVHFDYTKIYYGYPFQKQIFDLIKEAGPEGISSADLGRATTMPRLDVRNSLRTLLKKNNVITLLVDRGRQKVTKYIAKMYESENEAYSVVKDHELSSTDKVKRKAASPDSVGECVPPKKRVRFDDEIEKESKERQVDATVSDFQNIVSQVKELQSSEEFSGRSPKVVSVSEKPLTSCINSITSPQITYRKLKRSEMIINYLKEVKFSTISDLQKMLREVEKDEKHLLDKKSTARVVHNLANIKKIKIFKVVLKLEDKVTSLEYICDNSLESTDPCIKAAIEQAKFRYFCVNKDKEKVTNSVRKDKKENLPMKAETDSGSNKDITKSNEPVCVTVYPKYIRASTLHKFLFYLVFQHEGKVIKSDKKNIYHDQMSWKRFVPPLPEYPENVKKGWCFLADIYSRIPLSIFVKIVAIRQSIPNLQDYLEDEEKQHYLIKYLPQDIRNALLDNRKYLFSTCDVIKNLCYMGLVTFGPQILKQKDQIYLYVHKNASLKDTTISSPGYIHVEQNLKYEIKPYTFKSLTDVDNFWFELENICFHTPLGKYNSVIGKTFAITEAAFKPELIKCVENVAFDKITDSGSIPGDGLGAGGFDTSLFMHIKRNWQSSTMIKPTPTALKNNSKVTSAKFSIQHLLKDENVHKPENRSRLQRLTKHSLSVTKKSPKTGKIPVVKSTPLNLKETETSSRRSKTRFRTVKSRPNKKRVPYYDDRDKLALKKMTKARCEWFPQEDTFLLLCRVASLFLDPLHDKNLVVPYTVVRDLLHGHLPEISDNKSSRACQRRIRYMMLNPITISNVAVFLGEANQDEALVQQFNKEKPPKIHDGEWATLFSTVLEKLLKKFSLSAADRCKNVIIPNNLEELHKKFEITYSRDILKSEEIHKDPKNISDVKFFVLCSLILSVMALCNNDVRWKYMLLQLYKKYPQNFLQSVIAHLRRKKLIAIKKSVFKSDVERAKSHSPYKFSVIYENSLSTKFPFKMFQEALTLHQSFSSINPETGVELKGDVPSGYAAYVLSLAAIGNLFIHTEIPEHIILFDASVKPESHPKIYEQIFQTLDKKESNELSKILNDEASSFAIAKNDESNITRTTVSSLAEDQASDDESNINTTSASSLAEDQASDDESSNMDCSSMRSTNASRYALYLLRQEKTQTPIERTQHSQDYIVLNSCRLFCRLKENPDIILPINPPEIIEEIPSLDKTVSSEVIMKDQIELDDNDITSVMQSLTLYVPPEALKRDNYPDILETLYENYSPQTLLEGEYIFSYIYQAETIGVSEKALWEKFFQLLGELTWFEHLKILCESFLILRVGILSFSYVCIQYAKVWLLESCLWSDQFTGIQCDICASDESPKEDQQCNHELSATYFDLCEKVYFIPRTWRNPDGTLNKSYFLELLNTVLSHIISTPSVSVSDVCERFAHVMQPVQTLELIEVLEKIKCVYKYYCKPLKKSTLFSKTATIHVTEKPGPDCIAHVENYPNAICKIAKLQNCLI